jgi:hypothetical protein
LPSAFEQTLQDVQDEKAAEKMGLEEKEFKDELGRTIGASPKANVQVRNNV